MKAKKGKGFLDVGDMVKCECDPFQSGASYVITAAAVSDEGWDPWENRPLTIYNWDRRYGTEFYKAKRLRKDLSFNPDGEEILFTVEAGVPSDIDVERIQYQGRMRQVMLQIYDMNGTWVFAPDCGGERDTDKIIEGMKPVRFVQHFIWDPLWCAKPGSGEETE